MISLIQAIVLSIIEGITEWFPVSSKGHLYLLQSLFGFQSLSFDVFLHLAAVLAVIILFWKDLMQLLFNLNKKTTWKYIGFLVLATIPAAVIGFLFKNWIENTFYKSSTLFLVGIFFMISGILIYSTKFFKPKNKPLNWFDSLFIGIFQAIALLPGISRSGSTISSGIFRGLSKEDVIKFSFLMAIPAILGAGVLELKDIGAMNVSYTILATSFIVTFLVSVIAIKALVKILKSDKFYLFGVYNFILGVLVLIWSFM